MGGCRCSYKNCKRSTNNSEKNFHFFHYPSKDYERSLKWIANARKPLFLDLPKDQLRNKVVCQNHFEPHYFTNVSKKRLIQAAVPTLDVGCTDEPQAVKVTVLQADEKGTVFTVDTEPINVRDVNQVRSFLIANGDIVPASAALEGQNETQIRDQSELYSNSYNDLKVEDQMEVVQETFVKTELDNNNDQYDIPELTSIPLRNGGPKTVRVPASPPPVPNTSAPVPNAALLKKKLNTILPEKNLSTISVSPPPPPPTFTPVLIKEVLPNSLPLKKKLPTTSSEEKPKEVSPNISSISKTVEKHTKEIMNLKKILRSRIHKTKRTKMDLLSKLRTLIPSTLCAAVSLHLFKKEENFTHGEKQFLRALHESSPTVIDVLNDRLKWKLPRSDVVRNMLLNRNKLR
ncbi:hypothetical protein PPYR_05566 [Photinus pyralis]|uniref:THAP-type domain-containing protein n=1 Tax=Photinus pyralis TaxID=7054 RepID=A0A1Y1MGX2_PHOPY|nr:uncharacterized protein LOC116166069 [Photinus pyralis]KAB0801212.1 hypothetical protein PPYR_05566 [Photinus pyralis]